MSELTENKIKISNLIDEVIENFNYFLRDENIKKEIEKEIKSKEYVDSIIEDLVDSQDMLSNLENIDNSSYMAAWGQVILINSEISYWNHKWENVDEFINHLFPMAQAALSLKNIFINISEIKELKKYEKKAKNIISTLNNQKKELENSIAQSKILRDDLKNKKVNEIFENDSKRFKKIARIYESLFYLVVLIAGLYFLGLTFYIVGFDYSYLSIGFPEKIHGNISAEFYIQKISFLVLSTTLAAFLLKRSFMNRRLADEAYRTAKELDALPRYMEGMPDEMKEKIRFDLAYKYFGNGIHHDSYTSGENLMHENIKANTEFMKIVKGVPSTTDESKTDKDKNE